MGETVGNLISGGSIKKAEKEQKRAATLQRQQEADVRKKAGEEEKKRKSRAKALEARGGGLGVTLFMSELGVERATTLGG